MVTSTIYNAKGDSFSYEELLNQSGELLPDREELFIPNSGFYMQGIQARTYLTVFHHPTQTCPPVFHSTQTCPPVAHYGQVYRPGFYNARFQCGR